MAVPIIDLFAGPGGLGEGFSALRDEFGRSAFRIALSVEKDPIACRTLRLRAVRRQLETAGLLDSYFALLRREITREAFEALPAVSDAMVEADREVLHAELGKVPAARVDARIRQALGDASTWVLIGGPPCQAYSLAGRARRANDATFASDEKHFLYTEYLRILRAHAPPVFVMENVKGLLSSRHSGSRMFDRIRNDLASPASGLSYEIRSLVRKDDLFGLAPGDYLIESERYGVPQTRHRVILLGVRTDLAHLESRGLVAAAAPVSVTEVLEGLPPIRSRLSRGKDTAKAWQKVVASASRSVAGWGVGGEGKVVAAMERAAGSARAVTDPGGEFIAWPRSLLLASDDVSAWLHPSGLGGVVQHEARKHMAGDLKRYLFAACFAQEFGLSPKLDVFPRRLLPRHRNVSRSGSRKSPFPDRFRVQCAQLPANTIVSHISKDGHYYIHPDPVQCRSLTVREAARIQTFPDDYWFEGNRTQQYVQVGNAVPPLLARQIAGVVIDLVRPRAARPRARSGSRAPASMT